MLYLDSSAIAKLVMRETESLALEGYLNVRPVPLTTSILAHIEVVRGARRFDEALVETAKRTLGRFATLPINEQHVELAGAIGQPGLRSLDAIHLASAQLLGDALTAFVTYDTRLAASARALGMNVVAPA